MKLFEKNSLKWLKRITFAKRHSAFTDLISTSSGLVLCYRLATDHVSRDGVIAILQLNSEGQVISRRKIAIAGADIRDPKLSRSKDNKIYLLAYARYTDENNNTIKTDNVLWVSDEGASWSSQHSIGIPNWWLWRIRWSLTAPNTACGLAYNRRLNRVDFYKGDPRRAFHLQKSGAFSLAQHGKGYPNESDVSLGDDGRVFALLRRDADSFTAQFGESSPPYQHWQWHDLGEYIGGPCWLPLRDNYWIVSGRAWTGRELVTRLWLLNGNDKTLSVIDSLQSCGDNSYPGLAMKGNSLYVSYYSSHNDDASEIYLARYDLATLALDKIK